MAIQEKERAQKLSFFTLLAATGLAIADPVLRIFGKTPTLFSHFNLDSTFWIVAFGITVVLAPTVLLWLLIRLSGTLSPRLASIVGMVVIGLLALAWGIQLGKWSLGLDSPWLVSLIGAGAAIALLVGLKYVAALTAFFKIFAVVPAISLMLFLGTSQTSGLLENQDIGVASNSSSNAKTSVLFLLLDEFPTGALLNHEGLIDATRYPNLAGLGKESTWYKNYTVLADNTGISVPSLLSGSAPSDSLPTAKKHPTNLFALLAPTHHLTAYETLTSLCAYRQCSEGPPGELQKAVAQPTQMLGRVSKLWLTRVSPWAPRAIARDDFAEELVEAASETGQTKKNLQARLFIPEKMVSYSKAKPARLERFKDTFTADKGPALYFMHLELPHSPWRFYEDGSVYEAPKKLALTREDSNRVAWMASIAEYRFQIQATYTDSLVGGVIARMKAKGLWDDALVIVTADHGRSFKLNTNHRRAAWNTLDQIAFVPLLIKTPGQSQGIVDSTNLMAYDLLPTIADTLSIDLPWPVEGFSIGDDRIRHRAHRKDFFLDKGRDFFKKEMAEKKLFSMTKEFPETMMKRFINTEGAQSNFTRLLAQLQSASYIGQQASAVNAVAGGTIIVEDLERLRRPEGRPPMGMIMGVVANATPEDEVVVAINGAFTTASPAFKFKGLEGSFLAMLPNGTLAQENTLEFFALRDGELLALTAQE